MKCTINVPENVYAAIKILNGGGYEAFVVGGCVRDSLLGHMPHDWDIATSARPEQIQACFAGYRTLETGLRHGTLTVLLEGEPVEVTTYRIDGVYRDYRRPDSVSFTAVLEQDLARRDFTINAMAWHPDIGLVDPYSGRQDLAEHRIACVGDAICRMSEDALRILRALRFASALSFEIAPDTARALHECKSLLGHIARERIFTEICKLLVGKGCKPVLTGYAGILAEVLPEISPMIGFDQRNYHHYLDVWNHTAEAVENVPPELVLRLTMLFHDSAKPFCFTADSKRTGHFYGHSEKSAEIAQKALLRLRAPAALIRQTERLILYHDTAIKPEAKHVRQWLAKLGEEDLRLLLQVKRADASAKVEYYKRAYWHEADKVGAILDEIIAQAQCFRLADLAISGRDLLADGVPEGERVGRILNTLLKRVIDGELPNERNTLLDAARLLL